MLPEADFTSRYRGRMARLNHAFAAGDAAAFEAALEALEDGRPSHIVTGVIKLSGNLHQALKRFRNDPRMGTLAHREIPDARLRLEHVLAVTEEAAHKTMDLIERTVPLANATVREATALADTLDDRSHNDIRRFLDETRGNFEAVRTNLSEVMLTHLTGVSPDTVPVPVSTGLAGPAVRSVSHGAITDQSDVDDLMAGLGL
jgi:chemotaxis protein CheZ